MNNPNADIQASASITRKQGKWMVVVELKPNLMTRELIITKESAHLLFININLVNNRLRKKKSRNEL